MSEVTLKQIIEGLLMASERPLRIEDLYKIICADDNSLEISKLQEIINEIIENCKDRGVELKEVASGFRFQVRSGLSQWVNKLYEERPPRYSRALLETLSLIAYRQPITRGEIESVRGVTVGSNIMKTLLEHEWVRIIGQKEVPGRPAIFATTKKFLDYFNLKSLDELPPLMEFTETLLTEGQPQTEAEIALASVDESSFTPEEIKISDASVEEMDNYESELLDIVEFSQ
ncbi:segregation and condensation protein B [Gammaproteobacteria bacterium]